MQNIIASLETRQPSGHIPAPHFPVKPALSFDLRHDPASKADGVPTGYIVEVFNAETLDWEFYCRANGINDADDHHRSLNQTIPGFDFRTAYHIARD